MKIGITILFLVIFLAEASFGQFFPHWTFVEVWLRILNRIFLLFSFYGFLFSVFVLCKVKKTILFPIGVLLFSFFFISSCGEIFPIDTTTQPVDISILKRGKDGQKVVIREYENVKTHRKTRDSVLVKDLFIFRRIYN